MISFLNYEVYLSKFLILTSFFLLIFITFAVIYISYVSWKDKKRLTKSTDLNAEKREIPVIIIQEPMRKFILLKVVTK